MSDSESEALAYEGDSDISDLLEGDSDISDLLEDSLSSDSGKECDRATPRGRHRGRKLRKYRPPSDEKEPDEKPGCYIRKKVRCRKNPPRPCDKKCDFAPLYPELHTGEFAGVDGPFSDSCESDSELNDEESEE